MILSVGRRVYESGRILSPGCNYALERPRVPGGWSVTSRTFVQHADRVHVPDAVLEEAQINGNLIAVLVLCGRDLECVKERGDRDPDVVLGEVLARADAAGQRHFDGSSDSARTRTVSQSQRLAREGRAAEYVPHQLGNGLG